MNRVLWVALLLCGATAAAQPADGGSAGESLSSPENGVHRAQIGAEQEANAELPALSEVEGCEAGKAAGLFSGPVTYGFYEADVGTGRRACPRTEVGVGGRAQLVVDVPDFYGNIVGTALVFGSVAVDAKTEVFGTLEAYNYNWVQNASLQGSRGTLGQLTLGATRILYRQGSLLLAPSARVMLPTSLGTNARVLGAEVGVAYNQRLLAKLELHGYGGVDGSAGISAAPAYGKIGALLNFGAEWNFCSGFGVVVDANAHFARRAALDYLAPAVALRFRVGRVGAELGATVPAVGADRHDVAGGLKVAYRF